MLADTSSHDAVGNRNTTGYSVNTSNELTASPGASSYTYDNNGNRKTEVVGGATTTYNWDFENRLTSVVLASGGTVYFKYDPFGRRIQKTFGSATTNYLYDGANLIEEVNSGGTVTASYTQGLGIDETLADIRSGVTSYYEADGLGSTTSLTDTLGGVVATYEYDSFGNAVRGTEGGRASTTTRYTGRQFDPETGLYYYRARYYDPTVGRFISEDPIGFSGSVNFYTYAINRPLVFADPSGLATVHNDTGSPVLVSGDPGTMHGSGGAQAYSVVPPGILFYQGGQNFPLPGYQTVEDALNAYYGNGQMPTPVGNIYDVDFYSPTPLTPNTRPDGLTLSQKIYGDEFGPNYTLTKNSAGSVSDSLDSVIDFAAAGLRRINQGLGEFCVRNSDYFGF